MTSSSPAMHVFPFLMCPSCGEFLDPPVGPDWGCRRCSGVVHLYDGIPAFAIRSSGFPQVLAGIRASHEFNLESPASAHLNYTAQTVKIHEILRKAIVDRLGPAPNRRITVLDVGGGRGELASLLAQSFDAAMIDVDLASAQVATKLQACGGKFAVLCSDCSALPIAPHSFDVVIAKDTSHHMPDPKGFFRELGRVVKPHGLVLIVEGLLSALTDRQRVEAQDRMRQLGATHHHYVLRELLMMLEEAFLSVGIEAAKPAAFQKLLRCAGRTGSELGARLDHCWSCLPQSYAAPLLQFTGGVVVLACQKPKFLGNGVASVRNRAEDFRPYPTDLAEEMRLSDEVVSRIQELVTAGSGSVRGVISCR